MRSLLYLAFLGLSSVSLLGTGWAAAQEPAATKASGDETVLIICIVPTDAQIWVQGASTTATGSVREFLSPPLKPGKEYIYTVRVRCQRNGQTVDETRNLTVHAGDAVHLNYSGEPGGYSLAPSSSNAEQAFYFNNRGKIGPRPLRRSGSYYGDTPGWGTARTTGAGG